MEGFQRLANYQQVIDRQFILGICEAKEQQACKLARASWKAVNLQAVITTTKSNFIAGIVLSRLVK